MSSEWRKLSDKQLANVRIVAINRVLDIRESPDVPGFEYCVNCEIADIIKSGEYKNWPM